MRYTDNGAEDIKIAYIGGGSRGWAWGLMSDLAAAQDMSGIVFLYDNEREDAAPFTKWKAMSMPRKNSVFTSPLGIPRDRGAL